MSCNSGDVRTRPLVFWSDWRSATSAGLERASLFLMAAFFCRAAAIISFLDCAFVLCLGLEPRSFLLSEGHSVQSTNGVHTVHKDNRTHTVDTSSYPLSLCTPFVLCFKRPETFQCELHHHKSICPLLICFIMTDLCIDCIYGVLQEIGR